MHLTIIILKTSGCYFTDTLFFLKSDETILNLIGDWSNGADVSKMIAVNWHALCSVLSYPPDHPGVILCHSYVILVNSVLSWVTDGWKLKI